MEELTKAMKAAPEILRVAQRVVTDPEAQDLIQTAIDASCSAIARCQYLDVLAGRASQILTVTINDDLRTRSVVVKGTPEPYRYD